MIQYILECVAFQLVFLIIYDFFLKRETFFQWNRLYLLGTHVLSLLLPWVKIEAFKTTVPVEYYAYPEFLWNSQIASLEISTAESSGFNISWQEGILILGILAASVLFAYKMWQLYQLRKKGEIHYYTEFTQIIVANSNLAFSFFKSIFLGDKVINEDYESIIKHELVHIKQRHSWDLLFFELLRIVFWFNPLVYVYQSRISELHEFIADAHVAKTNKKKQYQVLLAQVFQTQHISFVNQFFNSSLIKKRIVMLQKSRSKKVWQLKYLLLLPIVVGMLFYTSLEGQETTIQESIQDQVLIEQIKEEVKDNIKKSGSVRALYNNYPQFSKYDSENPILLKEDFFRQRILWQEMTKEINSKYSKGALKSNLKDLGDPSTLMYNSYVNRTKAFQLLDKNLDISIDVLNYDVILIKQEEINATDSYVFKVVDIADLTANEIRSFNGKMEEVFEKESKYNYIIMTDNISAIRILKKVRSDNDGRSITRDKYTFKSEGPVISFSKVDEVPEFPGCESNDDKRACFQEKMMEHIRKHFNYPKEAQEKNIQGRVAIRFIISEAGKITKIETKGPDPILEKEAERIISRLPEMKPGRHNGQTANVSFSIPISFKLSSENGKNNENQSHDDYQSLLSKEKGTNPILENLMLQYNQLVRERKRLLKNSSEGGPIIQNLDQQLLGLKQQIANEYEQSLIMPFAVIDEVPVFPGCESDDDKRGCFQEKLREHISKNFRYPEEAQKLGIQGRVNVMFTIDLEGNIVNIRIRGPHKLLEEEAIRIIKRIPQLKPGVHKGKKVKVPFSIPITFKLQGKGWEPDLTKLANMTENIPIFFVDGEASTKEIVMAMKQEEIEAIFALKGEAAQKKYGDKGKNGVVEITSKKKE